MQPINEDYDEYRNQTHTYDPRHGQFSFHIVGAHNFDADHPNEVSSLACRRSSAAHEPSDGFGDFVKFLLGLSSTAFSGHGDAAAQVVIEEPAGDIAQC